MEAYILSHGGASVQPKSHNLDYIISLLYFIPLFIQLLLLLWCIQSQPALTLLINVSSMTHFIFGLGLHLCETIRAVNQYILFDSFSRSHTHTSYTQDCPTNYKKTCLCACRYIPTALAKTLLIRRTASEQRGASNM